MHRYIFQSPLPSAREQILLQRIQVKRATGYYTPDHWDPKGSPPISLFSLDAIESGPRCSFHVWSKQSLQRFPLAHLAGFSVALPQLSKGETRALSPRAQDECLLQGCSACGWRWSSGRVLLTHIRRLSDGVFQGQTRTASPHLRY